MPSPPVDIDKYSYMPHKPDISGALYLCFSMVTGSTKVDILVFWQQEYVEKYHRSGVVKYFLQASYGLDFMTVSLMSSEK